MLFCGVRITCGIVSQIQDPILKHPSTWYWRYTIQIPPIPSRIPTSKWGVIKELAPDVFGLVPKRIAECTVSQAVSNNLVGISGEPTQSVSLAVPADMGPYDWGGAALGGEGDMSRLLGLSPWMHRIWTVGEVVEILGAWQGKFLIWLSFYLEYVFFIVHMVCVLLCWISPGCFVFFLLLNIEHLGWGDFVLNLKRLDPNFPILDALSNV